MISIYPRMPLKKIYLWFGNFDSYAASLADPDCFDSNRNSSQIRAASPHGFYYINSDTLEFANGYLYNDEEGTMPVDLYGIIGNAWIADEYGNVTKLNIQTTSTTIDSQYTRTWSTCTYSLDYPFQYFQLYVKTNSSGIYPHGHYTNYGSAHRKYPDLAVNVSGNNFVSNTPYQTGKMNSMGGGYTNDAQNYIVDMSVSGMVKPVIRLDSSPSAPGNISSSNIFTTNTSATTMTIDSAGIGSGTFHNSVFVPAVDYTNMPGTAPWNGLGSQGRLNTQADYVSASRDTNPASLGFNTYWYIQYAFMTDPGQAGYGGYGSLGNHYGWTTADSYPLHNTFAICTYACTNQSYTSGYLNHGVRAHIPHMDTFYGRLFFKSSTPSLTGGDDNGDPPTGWYRETGTTTYYYWNGIRFVESN